MVALDEFEEASARAAAFGSRVPKAVSARFDRRIWRIVVELNTNLGVFFSPRDAEGLEDATPEQLDLIEISPSGYGLYFPRLDADLYLPAILEGVFGSGAWLARRAAAAGVPAGSPKFRRHGEKNTAVKQKTLL